MLTYRMEVRGEEATLQLSAETR